MSSAFARVGFYPDPVRYCNRVNDQPHLFLSIVIPAYNEERRLPGTLEAVDRFLSSKSYGSEVIVADDGSTDRTAPVACAQQLHHGHLRVLRLPHRGKANAVREGILAAQGRYVMFMDADLSTPMEYADLLLDALTTADVAIGSREGAGSRRIGEPAYRHLMGRVFNALVRLIAVPGINDTQCGFKAFTATAGQDLFGAVLLHASGRNVRGPRVTGFDVEILFLARKRGYDIVEIPVEWTHVAGSKVAPIGDSVRMFADVLRVRINAFRGKYDR